MTTRADADAKHAHCMAAYGTGGGQCARRWPVCKALRVPSSYDRTYDWCGFSVIAGFCERHAVLERVADDLQREHPTWGRYRARHAAAGHDPG